jgi:hypothetical protein
LPYHPDTPQTHQIATSGTTSQRARPRRSPAVTHHKIRARAYFGDGYYAANVFDPDGHSLEFVHKSYTPSWA